MQDELKEKIKKAMIEKDALKLSVFRMLQAEITNTLISRKMKPSDAMEDKDFIAVVQKLVKQREDSSKQYENAGRAELAVKEKDEATILKEFLPPQLSEDELFEVIEKHRKQFDLREKSSIGKLMKAVMDEVAGRADGKQISEIIRKRYLS